MNVQAIFDLLLRWANAGEAMACHILACKTCLIATKGGSGCAEGDRLWAVQMDLEAQVIAILPEIEAAGIDVETVIGGFKFMGHTA